MESYATFLQGLFGSIFADVSLQIPSIRRELVRDSSRIRSNIEARGLAFATLDLPDLGKHFDRCLADGRLIPSGGVLSRPYRKGAVIPRLFKGLLLRVFDETGLLRVDPDVVAIRALRQLYYAAKKLRLETSNARRFKTIESFFKTDNGLRVPSLSWEESELDVLAADGLHTGDSLARVHRAGSQPDLFGCDPDPDAISYDAADSLQLGFDIVAGSLGGFDPFEWRPKHGPGAVSDRTGVEYSKYSFPFWPEKLESFFPAGDFAYANYSDWAVDAAGESGQCGLSPHEPPSKLITVPKTQKAPRLIASEPTAHQWCQQIIWDFLSRSVSRTPISPCISFADQSRNGLAALEASRTQSHATVDLSEASDRLSCWLVERAFRRNKTLLWALHAVRTRWVVNTIDRFQPRYSYLRKFACMGSACTFPVQTIVFATVACVSVLVSRKERVTIEALKRVAREVRVFGDDIVIPTDGLDLFQGMLRHLQLKVNPLKTFGSGKFRESCGLDAYDGTDVTPTYSMTYPERTRPESIISCVETSNNFYRNGWRSVAAWIKSTVLSVVPKGIAERAIDSGSFGWKRHWYDHDHAPLRERWNARLQRREVACLDVYTPGLRLPDHPARGILQYFIEEPDPDTPWVHGITARPKSKKLRLRWEVAAHA